MGIALVTGATAGIGAEFARQLAAAGHDLVLVARDRQRLDETAHTLRHRYDVGVEVLAADLLTAAGLAAVEVRAGASEHPIDILVNNAGFGLRDPFEANTVSAESALLELLVAVPMRLMHASLAQMLPRAHGTIINISSVAGFSPRGSYGAAKAWVLSFSRWANITYRPRGVQVTAVAPGFVRSEFHQRMQVRTGTIPSFLWLDAERLVRLALIDVARGRAVSIPTLRYKLVVLALRLVPARISAAGDLTPL